MSVLIAIPGSEAHARALGARLGARVIVPEVRQFPDGELYVRIDGAVAGSLGATVHVPRKSGSMLDRSA